MSQGLDESLYPDREPPVALTAPAEQAEYLQRVCAAFDFGIPPEAATLRLLAGWEAVFDAFPLAHSPAYHALRACFGWPARERLPYLGVPGYVTLDAGEGRVDGFEDRI
jgi:hypothetical protein